MSIFNSDSVRANFPVLAQEMNGKPLVYLDTASSAQKPQCVLDALNNVLQNGYANIHRGLYGFSQSTTSAFEAARQTVANFIGANARDIVFTKGATEAINLVASSWGRANIGAGDEILITEMEHHANIVPWQLLAAETGATLKVCPITDKNEVDLAAFESLITPRVKLVAFTHMSNALGTINPVKDMVKLAKKHEATVLVDGAQAVIHIPVDIKSLGCDFYVFSGHKLYGPTGIGVLYGRYCLLNAMPPYQSGGDMIETVSFDKDTTFKAAPARFEAGTPPIAQAIGLAAAIDYITAQGLANIARFEEELYHYAIARLNEIAGITLYNTAMRKASILSFTANWGHHADIATLLDKQGIAVRAGHHCAMPLMERLGVTGTVRASLGMYTTRDDIDRFVSAMDKAKTMLE